MNGDGTTAEGELGIDLGSKEDGFGLRVKPKLGASVGAEVSGEITISIPNLVKAAGEAIQNTVQKLEEQLTECGFGSNTC